MKITVKTLLLSFVAIGLMAAEKAPEASEQKPTSLSLDEQEQVSRLMISFLSAQNELQSAQARMQAEQTKYQAAATKLQQEHHAEGCTLTASKEWQCPTPPPAASAKK